MRYVVGLLVVTVGLLGCGGGGDAGPERFDLSGSVTFDGKPLESGTLYIEPAPGVAGPAGFAEIVGGKYDTGAGQGKGHIGGKVVLRVVASLPPGQELQDEFATPNLPFGTWEEVVELPPETSTKDIAVPKDADKLMQKKQVQNSA